MQIQNKVVKQNIHFGSFQSNISNDIINQNFKKVAKGQPLYFKQQLKECKKLLVSKLKMAEDCYEYDKDVKILLTSVSKKNSIKVKISPANYIKVPKELSSECTSIIMCPVVSDGVSLLATMISEVNNLKNILKVNKII